MKHRFALTFATLFAALGVLLTACATNTPTIESRLTPGRILDDELLTNAIRLAIREEFRRNETPYQINTVVLDGRVFLIGSVQTQAHKELVSDLVEDFRHVRRIENELHVGELRTARVRNGDRRIGAAARIALLSDPRTRAQEFNVFVHKGVVYFIGITPRAVGTAAADIVKYVRGVQSVVLLIDYLD